MLTVGKKLYYHGNKDDFFNMVEIGKKDFGEIQAQWAAVRGRIRQKIGDAQFKSWIKVISLQDYIDSKVILSVPSNFVRTRIIEQYLDIMQLL